MHNNYSTFQDNVDRALQNSKSRVKPDKRIKGRSFELLLEVLDLHSKEFDMDKFILNFVDLHIEWYTRNNNVSYERRSDRRIETIDLNSANPIFIYPRDIYQIYYEDDVIYYEVYLPKYSKDRISEIHEGEEEHIKFLSEN